MIKKGLRIWSRAVRVTALIAAALMLMSASFTLPSGRVQAETVAELEAKRDRLKKEEEALNREIAKQENNMTDEKAYLSSINSQISNAKQQIALFNDRISAFEKSIDELNAQITKTEAEISGKEADIDSRMETLRARLRYISQTGNLSSMQMLLDTEDYTEYLVKSKVMGKLAQSSKEMMDALETEIAELDGQKSKLNENKSAVSQQLESVQSLKKEAESKKKELDVLYAKSNATLNKLEKTIKEIKQDAKKIKQEMEATRKALQAKMDANNYAGKYTAGSMLWPVPTVRNISSYFGKRTGDYHTGIDIANGSIPIYGESIIAAADGEVVTANTTNSWGGGYGYYVTINHGLNSNGVKISTLYGHMSKVLVSPGQFVKAGTVIGKAGATGNVTGPHLHFEVHENGLAIDPIAKGYVKRG